MVSGTNLWALNTIMRLLVNSVIQVPLFHLPEYSPMLAIVVDRLSMEPQKILDHQSDQGKKGQCQRDYHTKQS